MGKFTHQPTKAFLRRCTIGGLSYFDSTNGNNFHVQELRIYEDICKIYFTGQLVIESHLNTSELFLNPGAEVVISFEAPRSDGGPTKIYTEKFRVYSYESKPREGDITNSMVITISLIGDEYYNDKANTVLENFANKTGTAAAAAIHNSYIAENGGLSVPVPSLGMIGQDLHPHQVLNKKPVKAIHDILDKCVFAAYKSCAPIYFRNANGYAMGPLEYFLNNGTMTNKFVHLPAQGSDVKEILIGYNNVINFRPMSPPGEDNSASRGAEIDNLFKKSSFFDLKTGNYLTNALSRFPAMSIASQAFNAIKGNLEGKVKGKYGGRHMFSFIDELRQPRAIDKNGPGGYNTSQDSFLSTLTYSQKYWMSVPLQTGINTTCGDRVTIRYPIGIKPKPVWVQKELFVPRLIHELRFTEGRDRKQVTVTGTTDLFCVHWGS